MVALNLHYPCSCKRDPEHALDNGSLQSMINNYFTVNSGIIIALAAHAIFAFLPSHVVIPYIAMCLIGIAYSMFACVLWPLIAFIVPEYQIGTAYGM